MATLIIEDGTGKANSNSYVTAAELDSFCSDRNITLTADYGDQSEILIKANDYLETLYFIGDRATEAQALQWPRFNVYIDGFSIESTTIPTLLKNGQMWLAVSIDAGEDPLSTLDRVARREKLGDMEIEYASSAASRKMITSFNSTIQRLLSDGGSLGGFDVVRC